MRSGKGLIDDQDRRQGDSSSQRDVGSVCSDLVEEECIPLRRDRGHGPGGHTAKHSRGATSGQPRRGRASRAGAGGRGRSAGRPVASIHPRGRWFHRGHATTNPSQRRRKTAPNRSVRTAVTFSQDKQTVVTGYERYDARRRVPRSRSTAWRSTGADLLRRPRNRWRSGGDGEALTVTDAHTGDDLDLRRGSCPRGLLPRLDVVPRRSDVRRQKVAAVDDEARGQEFDGRPGRGEPGIPHHERRRSGAVRRRTESRRSGSVRTSTWPPTRSGCPPPLWPGAGRLRQAQRMCSAETGGMHAGSECSDPTARLVCGEDRRPTQRGGHGGQGGGWAVRSGRLPLPGRPRLRSQRPASFEDRERWRS